MFKFKFHLLSLVLFALFLSVYSPLKAANSLSGGSVLFDDEVERNIDRSNQDDDDDSLSISKESQQYSNTQVTKAPIVIDTENNEDVSQVDSTELEIKPNFKQIDREKYLDEHSIFQVNQEQNFYGINLLVLKINVKRDKSGKIISLLPERETQPVSYINERNNPDYYLNIERSNYRTRDYAKSELYESHKYLLRSFVKKMPRDQDAVIIMYVNGSNLKNYSGKEMQLEKMIYAQFVTNFLYRNKRKLTIERRYVDDIPENEILLIISKYEGNIPPNIYNASKGNILQWLARYKEIERQQVTGANSSRANLEQSLNSTTVAKNPNLLLSPIDRELKIQSFDIQMSEEDLYKTNTRKVKPREITGADTGPRRVVSQEEEIIEQDITEEEIAQDENMQLDDKNKELEAEDTKNSNPTEETEEETTP